MLDGGIALSASLNGGLDRRPLDVVLEAPDDLPSRRCVVGILFDGRLHTGVGLPSQVVPLRPCAPHPVVRRQSCPHSHLRRGSDDHAAARYSHMLGTTPASRRTARWRLLGRLTRLPRSRPERAGARSTSYGAETSRTPCRRIERSTLRRASAMYGSALSRHASPWSRKMWTFSSSRCRDFAAVREAKSTSAWRSGSSACRMTGSSGSG